MITYRASRTPKQVSRAGWNAILPSRVLFDSLGENRHYDVAIIGGGFTGLAAARRLFLGDPHLRICVIEALEFAEGSAGRNSGFMIDLPHDLKSDDYIGDDLARDKEAIKMNRIAIDFARTLAQECHMPDDFFNSCGKINAAATVAGDLYNQKYSAYLSRLGEPFEVLSQDDIRRLTGSPHYTSGLITPRTVLIQPAGFIRFTLNHLCDRVDLFEKTSVQSLSQTKGSWILKTPKGEISAKQVILATNGHLESFGFYQRRLMHICLYASMSAPMSNDHMKRLGGERCWGVTPADPMGTSVRRISGISGDRILIRTGASFNPNLETTPYKINKMASLHQRKFIERFPMLEGLSMAYEWSGMLCLTGSGVSAFGEIEKGLYAACVQNGLGVTRGTLQGMAIADLILGKNSSITSYFSNQKMPKKLPPQPLATIGANTYLRWKTWRAGAE